MSNYSVLSRELTKTLTKNDKKTQGIYFTPPQTTVRVVSYIKSIIPDENDIRILEPSCGSGEFITKLKSEFPMSQITGIENNHDIYKDITDLNKDNVEIFNTDYLEYSSKTKYNLIIGNPPYFVMKKDTVSKEYYEYFDGRPNIFILFIIKALRELKDDGFLSFVLPTNFLNCLYYNKTRRFIHDHFEIMNIMSCSGDNYIETNQHTIVLVLKKSKEFDNEKYSLILKDNIIFGEHQTITELRELLIGSNTLTDAGFDVKVGSVVWNQCKTILTDDRSYTRLIYSTDIDNKTIVIKTYKNTEKKHYIKKSGVLSPSLVVNRGYGSGKYNFEYCLINGDFEYLIENHLICITDTRKRSKEDLINIYNNIMVSFEDPRTKKFIELYFGNSAMNTTELKCILPIYNF